MLIQFLTLSSSPLLYIQYTDVKLTCVFQTFYSRIVCINLCITNRISIKEKRRKRKISFYILYNTNYSSCNTYMYDN